MLNPWISSYVCLVTGTEIVIFYVYFLIQAALDVTNGRFTVHYHIPKDENISSVIFKHKCTSRID